MPTLHHIPGGPRVAIDAGGSLPLVSVQLWFDVGSAYEEPEIAGAAHLLEHMLFKSAEGLPAGEAVARLEALGGAPNAWTSLEQTALMVTLPSRHLGLAVQTLAQMGTRPLLLEEELAPERGVVLEELREAEDDPGDVLAEALRGRVFGDHPYGRSVLGTAASVTGLDAPKLRAFHQRWYRPSNATLIVSGPVEEAEVLALARAHLPPEGAATPRPVQPCPADSPAPGVFCLDPDFDERLVEIAVPIPTLDHPDVPALDLLAVGLGDGGSALLPQILRHEKDLVMSCWAALENERAGGLFVAGLSAREGQALDAVQALAKVLAQVAREGLPAGVLRRARAAVLADRMRDRETVDGRTARLAWYVANRGDPAADLAYEAAIQRVTPRDVQRVAARYLDPDRWVVGGLGPKAEMDGKRLKAAIRRGLAQARPVQGGAAPRTTVATLACGARVLVEPDPDAELLGLSVLGLGGAIACGPRDAGLPSAWSALVARGAGDLDAVAFAAAVEERAGSLRPWAARNSCGVQAAFPGGEVATAVSLLADLLNRPRFDPVEVARTQADLLEIQRTMMDDSGDLARHLTLAGLYPGHAWGRSTVGTPASVARMKPNRLLAHHRRVICGSNLVLALCGAVDAQEVVALLDRALARMPLGRPVQPAPPVLPERFTRRRWGRIQREGSPTEVVLAFPAPGQESPEEPALRLLEAVLGGVSGGSGRLFDRMREREGLSYSVSAGASPGIGGGAFSCAVTADPARARLAEAALWEELQRIVDEPVPAGELARVQAGLVEGALVGVQRAISRADHLSSAERYLGDGLRWRDRLDAPARVDAAALQALARSVLRRDRSVTVRVGPAAGLR